MKRRSQDQWQQLITEQAESGLSATQFCKERGINDNYFSTVKHKLKRQAESAGPFQMIGTLPQSQALVLQVSDVTLRLPHGVDPHWLAALVHELRS